MSIELPRNFWKPPATGYSERDAGLTHAQLNAIEARNGFRLPLQYKALMQMQNGGCLRYSECGEILLQNFESLSVTDQDVVTFEDHALITCSQEAIDAWKQATSICKPERLVVFADGMVIGCFDYGWQSEAEYPEPQIIFFKGDGSDFLHFGVQATFNNFGELLDGLKLTEFEGKKTFLGIDSALEFEALCEQLRTAWQTHFVPQSDDHYGWFNFERWYKTDVPLFLDDQTLSEYADANGTSIEAMLTWLQSQGPGDARRRLVKSLISPNRHRSGTCLYPDDPDLTAVLEIPSVWFPKARAVEQLAAELSAMSGVRNVVRLPF